MNLIPLCFTHLTPYVHYWSLSCALTSPRYYIDDVACADPELCQEICGNPVGCSDTAYARLVMELLPAGERLLF